MKIAKSVLLIVFILEQAIAVVFDCVIYLRIYVVR
jgi:hypothetical protein